ncbi:MAG: dynamin family protein [Nitrococcus sp.]|nr:dynamin family protein [Nitrococcus sp.]
MTIQNLAFTGQAVEPIAPQRPRRLEEHLEQEGSLLLQVLSNFRQLDRVGQRMGLLAADESYTSTVSWWPVVSVLGTFSSGKSTFLNEYLQYKLQLTGNQAVDDRFTVICYGAEGNMRTLPGSALDADPRFPFYRIGAVIDAVSGGEGARIDNYLQLKTVPSEKLKRKIFVDSPGFDADQQRDATLKITDRIIDLSDLVLVMFDARHPEPGAMRDTLEHLVGRIIKRPDAGKFMYVLNQIDAAAAEDNLEDVVAAWQRALASYGLTTGRFFRIYNEDMAGPIQDDARRVRLKAKKDEDLAEIHKRIQEVEIGRAYRVADVLAHTAKELEQTWVPQLAVYLNRWRQRVWIYDGLTLGLAILLALAFYVMFNAAATGLLSAIGSSGVMRIVSGIVLLALALAIHFSFRRLAARQMAGSIRRQAPAEDKNDMLGAFLRNTRWTRSLLWRQPAGWGAQARRLMKEIIENRVEYVQNLNDRFTNPSAAEKDQSGQTRLV